MDRLHVRGHSRTDGNARTMSKASDEDEDDECYYESLDRLLSSSRSCSSSNSDDDPDPNASPNYASEHHFPIPKFPIGASKYDVWISEPSSIQERRSRLLREMGLSNDLSLSRLRPSADRACADFCRSVSSDRLADHDTCAAISRSKSDGAKDQCNSSSVSSPPILSICSVVNNSKLVNSRSSGSNGSPVNNAASTSPNKPPSGKIFRRVDDTRADSVKSEPSFGCNSFFGSRNGTGGECDEDSDCNVVARAVPDDQVCTIKNLDNGKEFVVNELREDGMWNKLKEVETGRQLTMEEFEMCVGHSPIVQELMRRQNVEECIKDNLDSNVSGGSGSGSKSKKKGSWFRSIRSVATSVTGHRERRSSDERDTSSEKGGRRSSSATDDSQEVSFHGPERIRVRQYGKSCKELSALYKSQEIQAHNGSIWCIKFSLDGRFLASAGEDCVIHVWQVVETERKGELLMDKPEDGNLNFLFMANGSPEPTSMSPNLDNHSSEKKRRGRTSISRKSVSLDHIVVPETVFGLSEKPFCSFEGHVDDVLDLSWSKSQVSYCLTFIYSFA